jgi:hypothetical protein
LGATLTLLQNGQRSGGLMDDGRSAGGLRDMGLVVVDGFGLVWLTGRYGWAGHGSAKGDAGWRGNGSARARRDWAW